MPDNRSKAETGAVSSHIDCSCADRGPLFHLAQRMEEVIVAQRDGYWSSDWERVRDSVLGDYDAWRHMHEFDGGKA